MSQRSTIYGSESLSPEWLAKNGWWYEESFEEWRYDAGVIVAISAPAPGTNDGWSVEIDDVSMPFDVDCVRQIELLVAFLRFPLDEPCGQYPVRPVGGFRAARERGLRRQSNPEKDHGIATMSKSWVLVSSLYDSSFIPGISGIGTQYECARSFATEEEALAYGANLLRTHILFDDICGWDHSVNDNDRLLVDAWNTVLKHGECFQVIPLVTE